MSWEPNIRIPGQKSKASPAIAEFNGQLHIVHLGDSSNNIWHSWFDGSTWAANVRIEGQQSKAAPALAASNGLLHMVHLGDSSNDIWHSTFNGSAWTPNVRIGGQKSKASPALAVYNNQLHMVHLGDSSNNIWHSWFDGSTWAANVRIEGQQSKAAPALAASNGLLHMVHLGDSSNDIWHSTFNGNAWTPNERIEGQKSKSSPSLASFNGRPYMVHLGDSSNRIWYSEFYGGHWSVNVAVAQQLSKAPPSIASFDGRLYMVHLGDQSNDIWYTRLPRTLLIITPSQFLSVVVPLKTHKEKTGMLATIITLDEVNRSFARGDEAERVKRCIAKWHQQEMIHFVLLVGDSDTFPVRYTKTDRADEKACNTAFYPTDLYYSCLYKRDGSFDNWDGNGNGYYGELHGETHSGSINIDLVNLVPTVAVGRVPASSVEEVNCFVQKTIRYESQAYGANWAKNALLMATHDWIADACRVQERIAQDFLEGYDSTILSSAGSPCTGAGNLNATAVTEAFNRGVGLVGYIGHGSPDSLAIPSGWWGINNITQLTNTNHLPIMCAAGCDTAVFATLPPYRPYVDVNGVNHLGTLGGESFTAPPPQPACLQHSSDPDNDLATGLMVRTHAGVVAYLGGVTGMQMYEPLEYFFQGIRSSVTVGETWQWLVRHFYEVQGSPGTLDTPDWFAVARVHQPWKFMLFGDPSLRIGGATSELGADEGLLVKGSDDAVYLIEAGERRWITDAQTFECRGLDWNAIQTISDAQLNSISRGQDFPSRTNGTLLKGSGPAVFIMQDCQRRWITSPEIFNSLGLDWAAIQTISDRDLEAIPRGIDLS